MKVYMPLCLVLVLMAANICAQDLQTNVDDQTDVSVTVYNGNLALVRDQRTIDLPTGEFSLQFMDVAQLIKPETVSLRTLDDTSDLQILEQNYEYDLMSPSKLMEKYVGKKVRLVNFSTELGFSEVEATLLSMNESPIYQLGDEIYLGHPGSVVLPEIPANLIAKPTLVWRLDNKTRTSGIEATYLTAGISWKADYVLTLARDDKSLDMDAWVTLNNQSGAAYENARVKLVAGEVHQVRPEMKAYPQAMLARGVQFDAMAEESLGDFHLYTLGRRTTIKENQSKQVSLFRTRGVEVVREYEFRGMTNYYSQRIAQTLPRQKVDVFLSFWNRESNQLGMPLPAGIMRIYQEDSEGMVQFSGEDRIQHTPKDERVRLKLGSAFDIIGERTQTDHSVIAARVTESAFEVKLRNHKETAVTIDVVEPVPGDWTVLNSSHPYDKRDARTLIFRIDVEPDEEVVLTYTVRTRM